MPKEHKSIDSLLKKLKKNEKNKNKAELAKLAQAAKEIKDVKGTIKKQSDFISEVAAFIKEVEKLKTAPLEERYDFFTRNQEKSYRLYDALCDAGLDKDADRLNSVVNDVLIHPMLIKRGENLVKAVQQFNKEGKMDVAFIQEVLARFDAIKDGLKERPEEVRALVKKMSDAILEDHTVKSEDKKKSGAQPVLRGNPIGSHHDPSRKRETTKPAEVENARDALKKSSDFGGEHEPPKFKK